MWIIPSFGLAIISRVLEAHGYRVAMLPQPDWHTCADFTRFGRPRLGFLVTAGVIDSMVNHYTAAKKPRSQDAYSPGGQAGHRPDRATIVYCNRIREAYGNVPIAIGGVEASLRRFAHYDYWDDRVRNSILVDSGADVLMFGMGERVILEVAQWLAEGQPVEKMRIPGTCVMAHAPEEGYIAIPSAEEVARDKQAYARALLEQYRQQDPIIGKGLCQPHGNRYLLQNPPDKPLSTSELDAVYRLPFERAYHPMYEKDGGIPALEEVQFSIAATRGCFGACSFCALTFHQGRIVSARSRKSIVEEGKLLTHLPGFKGYIHDVGGPTANFRRPACEKQLQKGACPNRQCLFPQPCKNIRADHAEFVGILRELRALPGVKKVFIRSGIRYDYLLLDKSPAFLRELTEHHVSGQLKVAPEHVSANALSMMGKPGPQVFEEFRRRFEAENRALGQKAISGAVFHVQPSGLHAGGRYRARALSATGKTCARNRCRTSIPRQARSLRPCITQGWIRAPCSACTSPALLAKRPCSARCCKLPGPKTARWFCGRSGRPGAWIWWAMAKDASSPRKSAPRRMRAFRRGRNRQSERHIRAARKRARRKPLHAAENSAIKRFLLTASIFRRGGEAMLGKGQTRRRAPANTAWHMTASGTEAWKCFCEQKF